MDTSSTMPEFSANIRLATPEESARSTFTRLLKPCSISPWPGFRLQRAYWLWSLLNMAFLAVGDAPFGEGSCAALGLAHAAGRLAHFCSAVALSCAGSGFAALAVAGDSRVHRALGATARSPRVAGSASALFKFQMVLPLVLVLIFTQGRGARSALVKGFRPDCAVAGGIVGRHFGMVGLLVYPEFLLHLQTTLRRDCSSGDGELPRIDVLIPSRTIIPAAITALSILSARRSPVGNKRASRPRKTRHPISRRF